MIIERHKPVAVQVGNLLADRIRSQHYAAGSRLPSESELADELGVSRATVRSALARLAAEGLVLRKQGDGTYVNPHIDTVPTRLGGIWDFWRMIQHSGYRPSIRTLEQAVRPATEAEANALRLAAGAPVLAFTRLFCADEVPVVVTHSAAPVTLLAEPADQVRADLPLNEFMQRYFHRQISYVIFDIHTHVPSPPLRELLNMERQAPVLALDQVFYDKANQPLFYSRGYLQDTVIRLRLVQSWE
ncbi:MAG: GntR family transcriptional regulator [Caldilineales bacterium]|nr:GntR family transcriptional regulator [Caldilineales bacterium]MDW8317106.1 GntR family transcriptional regulator [Anaerolineae bacterium]